MPGKLGAGYASPQAFTITERALGDVGQVLEYRGFQLKAEHDSARAIEEFSVFSDLARAKLSELLNYESGAAVGLGKKYDEWFNEASADFLNKRLSSGNQQTAFHARATAAREEDLDILARHEAAQHKIYRKESQFKSYATTREEITKDPFAIENNERKVSVHLEDIDNLNQGHDNTAAKKAAKATLYIDILEAQANIDPKTARIYLKQWRDIIGPEEYSRLSAKLKEGVSNQNVQTAMVRIESDYDKDKDGRLTIDELRKAKTDLGRVRVYRSKYGINLSESQKVRSELQNLINTREGVEKEQIDDGTKTEHKQIVQRIIENDYAGGLELLKKSYWLKNHDPTKWQALYNDLTTEPKDDPVLFNELYTEVNTLFDDPKLFDDKASRIWTGKYKSLSPKTKEHAHDQLRQLWKAGEEAPSAKLFFQTGMKILASKDIIYPGENDEEKFRNRFDTITAWQKFFVDNKDDIPIEKYSEKFGELVGPTIAASLFDIFMGLLPFVEGPLSEKERIKLLEKTIRETRHGKPPKPKSSISPMPPKAPEMRELIRGATPEMQKKIKKAVKILEDNNKPVTQANIDYLIDRMYE